MADIRRPLSLQIGPSSAAATTCSSGATTTTVTSSSSATDLGTARTSTTPQQQQTTAATTTKKQPPKSLSWQRSSSSSSSASSSTSSLSSGPGTPDTPSLILPYLYVGDQAQTQIDTISSLNIKYILSLQSLPKFLDPDEQEEDTAAAKTGDNDQAEPSAQRQKRGDLHHQNRIDSIDTDQLEVRLARQTKPKSFSAHQLIGGGRDYQSSPEDDELVLADFSRAQQQYPQPSTSSGFPQPTPVVAECSATAVVEMEVEEEDDDENDDDDHPKQQQQQLEKPCINLDYKREYAEMKKMGSQKIDPNRLLPSANSSRDYLVKFKSCVNKLIRGKCINISDTFEQLVDRFFDETHSFIEEARRNKCNILVHCKAGISRSPTIAIAYLMKWKRLHLQDAYDFVKRCRPQISPNLNFMGQLMNYERRLLQHECQFRRQSSPSLGYLPNPKRPASLPSSLDSLGGGGGATKLKADEPHHHQSSNQPFQHHHHHEHHNLPQQHQSLQITICQIP